MNKLILVCVSYLIFSSAFAQRNAITWYQGSDIVSGFPVDYSEFRRYSDRNSGIEYFLSNDDKNLYLYLQSGKEVIQRKLIRLGLSIEFLVPERSERTARILFPAEPQDATTGNRPVQMQDIRILREAYLSRTNQFFTEGFVRTNGQLTLRRAGGLSARISADSLGMKYEIVIPLTELFGEDFTAKDLTRMDIEMTALIDAFPRPPADRSRDVMNPPTDRSGYPTGRRPGDTYRPGGGIDRMGPGAPRYSPSEGETDLYFKRQRIKQKFRLFRM